MIDNVFSPDEPFVVSFPTIVKAFPDAGGRRLISVQASSEDCDVEGDVVLQSALLDAAPGFLKTGQIDLDHISEIGYRYGIKNTSEFIVGVPDSVNDIGKGCTEVICELHTPKMGVFSKSDEVWEALQRNPPVRYLASIYGFPKGENGFIDCRKSKCHEAPHATRYVLRKLTWKSLALTKNPVNQSLTGAATIVSAKAFIKSLQTLGILGALEENNVISEIAKDASPAIMPAIQDSMLTPRNRLELLGHHALHIEKGKCPFAGKDAPLGKSVASFRDHFMNCCGLSHGESDILSLALMYALRHFG